MRTAHTLSSFVLAACTAAAPPAWAQAQATSHLATDPAATTVPLHHQPLTASGKLETVQADWHSAHAAVAAFPRGHADILAWEAAQARTTSAPAAVPSMPHGMHHHTPAPRPKGQP